MTSRLPQIDRSFLSLAGIFLTIAALFGLAAPVARATNIGATPHISLAGHYNYVVTGGTLRAANNATNPCALLSGNSGLSVNAGTSTATISGIPAGSMVMGAYLYFVGDGDTPDYSVTLNGNSLTANPQYNDALHFASANGGNADYNYFGGFINVTGLVSGNGNYTFGGLSVQNVDDTGYGTPSYCTNQGVVTGWALVVVYQNASEPLRVINIFDGLQHFYNSNITLTPGNFKIPTSPINGKMTVITWGGDEDINGGESLRYNSSTLSDALDPPGNQFNATINNRGINTSWGVDVDTYNITPYLAAGQTSGSTYYATGADDNYLTAQIISVTNVPVADVAITESHSGNFTAGANGVYILSLHNNGPNAATGTTTVTDVLPTGLTYVSAAGIGWTCGASGQNVSCTTTSTIANGANANPITLTVAVGGSAANPIKNTATVTVDSSILDNISSNNSSTDSAAVLQPGLSGSTKTVADLNGGDAEPGDVLEYTITLKDNGAAASNVHVTDDMPNNVTDFTVTSNAGGTDSSTATGGANNTGKLDISGISVPLNGSKTIVYDVRVKAGTAAGTTIDNTATIDNPYGTDANPAAPTITVLQSQVPASGNKVLYVYDNGNLTRTPQAGGGSGAVSITAGNRASWMLTPVLAKALTIKAGSQISVNLMVQCAQSGGFGCFTFFGNLSWTAALYDNTVSVGTQIGSTSPSASFNHSSYAGETANIQVGSSNINIAAGHRLILVITNTANSFRDYTTMQVEQYAGGNRGTVNLNVSTVINVDSVGTYMDTTCTTPTPTTKVYETNNPVFICAVVSDPFGSYDIAPSTNGTLPSITIKDANGTEQLPATSMTLVPALTTTATKTFEHTYTVPASPPATLALGHWTPSVTAWEGTEHITKPGTMADISHTANGDFDVEAPDLVVVKSVSVVSNPVEGTTNPKALPGATMRYSIIITNQGKGAVDNNQLVVTDPIPANTTFVVGSVGFMDGSTSSGLTLDPATNVSYSNDNGATWTNTPEGAVTNLRFSPQGSMLGKTGANAPACTITFKVKID